MPLSLVQRLLHTFAPHPLRLDGPVRMEVRPPLVRPRAHPWRRRLAAWLASGLSEAAASTTFADWKAAPPQSAALNEARSAFRAALQDLSAPDVGICHDHIRVARSLHELWHLRAEVFNLIARHRSQGEADRRLMLVDRHFSTRARRHGASAKDGHESVPPI
jgi:hypothetical protein